MIALLDVDGRCVPVIECNRCGNQITQGRGNVQWDWMLTRLSVVHKPGDCPVAMDRPAQIAEALHWPLWEELDTWLEHVRLNTGLALVCDLESCFECGAPAEQMHHVVPRSLGGTRTLPLCGDCHRAVHSPGQPLALGRLIQLARVARG